MKIQYKGNFSQAYQLFVIGIEGQYGALLVGTWWYWVSMGRYWLVLGGTGSVEGGTGWYLIVQGQ